MQLEYGIFDCKYVNLRSSMSKKKGRWKAWVAVRKEDNAVAWIGKTRSDVARYWRGNDGRVWRGIRIIRVEVRET